MKDGVEHLKIDRDQYMTNVDKFTMKNNIKLFKNDPTDDLVKSLGKMINNYTHLFAENTHHMLKPINTQAP